jgi:maltooligosyltrehalose trehalohydrolase
LRLWCPAAKHVALEHGGRRSELVAEARGWWHHGEALPAGEDYAFVVDDEGPFPDPRSAWQPHGVHGPSRVVDHAAFPWTDAGFVPTPLSRAVIYELHVGTFSHEGTFDGVVRRLDHLVALGVTHVELMPIAAFPGRRNWGYDGVSLFAVHDGYGGPEGFKRLVNACHARGLALLLDVVYNHLGPEGNYLERFGPYFTSIYHTPWGKAVNLDDAGSDEVRRFWCDNARMWLCDYHVDGLRLDAVHALLDRSAMHLLEELARTVAELSRELGRDKVLIAESDLNDPRVTAPLEARGFGMHAQWSDDFHHALHAALTGERSGYYADFGSLDTLAKALCRGFVYDGCYSTFRERRHGRALEDLASAGQRLLGYSQNHDQVGNRARGERLSHIAGVERARLAALLVLTSPFVPMLFQGEELASRAPFLYFVEFDDRALGAAVRRGRRREFGAFGWRPHEVPDPTADATFERSRLDWETLATAEGEETFDLYRRLIALRRSEPALHDGDLERVVVRCDEHARWLVMDRDPFVVALNFADRVQALPAEGDVIVATPSGIGVANVPAHGGLVLRKRRR